MKDKIQDDKLLLRLSSQLTSAIDQVIKEKLHVIRMQNRGVVLQGRCEDKGRRQHLAVRLDRHDEHPEQRE